MVSPSHVNPIIKLTEECNYCCYFCRYANHRQHDYGIPVEVACAMIEQCADYNLARGISAMNVIFHGGEPLLYPIEKIEKILTYEQRICSKGIEIKNSIQTNSSLITDAWIELLKRYNFSVGISLDGPVGLNGHYSNDQNISVAIAVEAYKRLKNEKIDCGLLSVITEKHIEQGAETFFDFLRENGIASVGLCYCFNRIDGKNVNPIMLGDYLIRLFELYYTSTIRISIREFDMVIRRILDHPRHECAMSCRSSCGSFFTIRPDGSVEFCDDYDLNHNGTLGNINTETLKSMIENDRYQLLVAQACKIVKTKCKECPVFHLCQSGCSRNDINGENYFCGTFKILYPYIEKKVKEYLLKRKELVKLSADVEEAI